ncbi:hypothetical protein ABH931_002061 [Streptacidiphilus sp. MAP12-33]|uniref:hypothetical protein n=1 Tax=Streptacidiphilus sp. MAP12-33 TaxID=3156266 RepID=UPI003514A262
MTHRGEPAPDQRPRRTRALALLGVLAVSAAVATWMEVHYTGGDGGAANAGGSSISQDSFAAPAGGDNASAAPSTLPESASLLPATVEIPAGPGNPNAFQATRYALGSSTNCADVLAPNSPSGVTTSCQGYVTASYVSADHSVVASVTVFGYPDAATARQAKPMFSGAGQNTLYADFRQPGNELPSVTPLSSTEQQRVEQVGRFVTVVQAAAATGAAQTQPGPLNAAQFTLSAQVGDTVLWDE